MLGMDEKKFLAVDLNKSMNAISKNLRGQDGSILQAYDLTCFHAPYIANLHRYGQLTMTEMTELVGMDKANTTRVVRDLISKGYVEKIGTNERKFLLSLSKRGKEIAFDFIKKVDRFLSKCMKDFTQFEKDTFMKLLNKLLLGVKNVRNCWH